jgi:hypothetical protein
MATLIEQTQIDTFVLNGRYLQTILNEIYAPKTKEPVKGKKTKITADTIFSKNIKLYITPLFQTGSVAKTTLTKNLFQETVVTYGAYQYMKRTRIELSGSKWRAQYQSWRNQMPVVLTLAGITSSQYQNTLNAFDSWYNQYYKF